MLIISKLTDFICKLILINNKKLSALVVLSWKNSIPEAFSFLQEAIKIDPKCDYAYETLGTLYIQT